METLYANVVSVHANKREIAVVFGAFFPDDNRKQATADDMFARIVMHPKIVDALVQVLQQVRAEADSGNSEGEVKIEKVARKRSAK